MIEANALCFAYSGRKKSVLENVDWAISGGEFEAIVGPNGCGKTTLLRLLAGELSPLSGHIQLKGKRLGDYPSAELAQHRSVLTQSPRLDFDFSVREVVLMGRSPFLATTSHSENLAAIDAALKALDLEHFAHRIYPELSRGEKQRVQLARVLAPAQHQGPKARPAPSRRTDQPPRYRTSASDLRLSPRKSGRWACCRRRATRSQSRTPIRQQSHRAPRGLGLRTRGARGHLRPSLSRQGFSD